MSGLTVKNILYTCCPRPLHPYWNRIEASDLGYRLARGVFWSMAGAVISRGLMLVASVLVARMLGKEGFGEYGIIQSTVGMFGVLAGFSMGLTATKHVAEFRRSDPGRAGRVIGLSGLFAMLTGGVMAFGLFVFAPWLAERTINAPHLAGVLRISALILFINALNGAQTGALSGFEAFKAIAFVNLFVGLISFPILVCGAYFGGLTGAVWALAINLGFNWLLNHIALRKEARRHKVPFTLRDCHRELPVLRSFALPATLSGILIGPAHWTCCALLTNQPNGYDEMGALTAALVVQSLLLFVSSTLSAPLLSMLSNAGTDSSDKLGIVNILSTWILGVIVAIPLLCFPEIAQFAFGSDYATYSFKVTFSLVMFCAAIITFKAGLRRINVANDLLWFGLFSNTLWAIILIVSAIFLVRWGASGLALSLVIAYVLQTVVLFPLYYSRKLVPKGTVFSPTAACIWSILAVLVLLNIIETPLLFRSIIVLPCMLLAITAFMRISDRAAFDRINITINTLRLFKRHFEGDRK